MATTTNPKDKNGVAGIATEAHTHGTKTKRFERKWLEPMLLQYRSVCVRSFRSFFPMLVSNSTVLTESDQSIFLRLCSSSLFDNCRGTLLPPRLQPSVNVAPVSARSSPDGKPKGGCSTRRRVYPTSNRAPCEGQHDRFGDQCLHTRTHAWQMLPVPRDERMPCRDGVLHAEIRNLRNTGHRTSTMQNPSENVRSLRSD